MTFRDFLDNPEGANKFRDNKNDGRRKQPRTLLKKPPDEESKMNKNEQKKKYFFMCGCFLQLPFYPRIALFEFLFLWLFGRVD